MAQDYVGLGQNSKFSDSKTIPQNLWNNKNCLLHRHKYTPLPHSTDTRTLANSFSTFLKDKIVKIKVVFQSSQNGQDNVNH